MKYVILGILLFVASVAFAQEEPERTPEGYRIIRINIEQTSAYKDSVAAEQKKIEEEKKESIPFNFSVGLVAHVGYKEILGSTSRNYYRQDTSITMFMGFPIEMGLSALIPLMKNCIAIRTGVAYETTFLFYQDEEVADGRYFFVENDSLEWSPGNILQSRLTIPMLLLLKTRTSPAMLEVGAQLSIPIVDKHHSDDLLDMGLRKSPDVSILIGGAAALNRYIMLDFLFDLQLGTAYSDDLIPGLRNPWPFAVKVGLIFTPF